MLTLPRVVVFGGDFHMTFYDGLFCGLAFCVEPNQHRQHPAAGDLKFQAILRTKKFSSRLMKVALAK